MKKTILALVISTAAFTSNAQVSFGVQGGAGLSSVTSKFDGKEQEGKKSVFGFKIGAIASIPVSDQVSFMPELNFVRKGGQFKLNETENIGGGATITTVGNSETNLSFVELPLNIAYNSASEEGSGFFGGLGPVLSFGIGGQTESALTIKTTFPGIPDQTISNTSKADIKFDGEKNATDGKDHFKGFEFGGNVFAGYKLSSGVFVKGYYNMGFSNLSPKDKTSFKTSYFGISVGYLFGSK